MKTEILNFSIGGFSQGNEKIIWQDNKLYHFFDGSFLDQDFITPTNKDWELFWDVVDTTDVWNWEKDYIDQGVLDGVQWELMIDKKGKQRRRIYGSNKYPKNFEALTNLINDISKMNGEIIGYSED